ncbi:MAG: guanylate kinase [Flavobacteriaceae bacterium]|nr:guanylate kinase [Flavobacteriaceae bacterium]
MFNKKLIVCSGPSGSGKTTLVNFILQQNLSFKFSISATSRPPRNNEKKEKDYYFFTQNEFKKKIQNDEFIEYEEVYKGIYYGTLKSELNRLWSSHNVVLFDVDVKGGINLKKKYPNETLSIFIKPPSINILKERLKKRKTETNKNLKIRINKAKKEILFASKFDIIIINDNLKKTKNNLLDKIKLFLKQK